MTCRPCYVFFILPTLTFSLLFCSILSLLPPLVITLYSPAILPPCLPIQLYFFPRLGAFTPCLPLVFSYTATPLYTRQIHPPLFTTQPIPASANRIRYPAPLAIGLSNVHPPYRHRPLTSTPPPFTKRPPCSSLRRHIITQTSINKLHLNLAQNHLPRPSSSQS